jgi:UrcA family protein
MTETAAPSSNRPTRVAGKSSAIAAFVACLLLSAVPGSAADIGPSRVRIADLDLNSDVDIAVREQRIETAARAACRAPDRISDPLIGYRRCIADTSASARARLDQAIRRSRADATQASANGQAGAAR